MYTIAPHSHKPYEAHVDRPQVNGGSLRDARLFVYRQSKNRQSKISCACLTVMVRSPEAVGKALMNKPWVAPRYVGVPKAEASHEEHTGRSVCATLKKPEQAVACIIELAEEIHQELTLAFR